MSLEEFSLAYTANVEVRLGEVGRTIRRRIGEDENLTAVKSYASTDFGPPVVSTVRFDFHATTEAAEALVASVTEILGDDVTLFRADRETFTLSFRSGEPFEDGPKSTAIAKTIVDSPLVDHYAPFYGSGPEVGDGGGWTHYDLVGTRRAVNALRAEIEEILGDTVVLVDLPPIPPLDEGTR